MDPRQAEVLTQFAKLLEVLSDPEGLKQLVVEAQSAIKQYNEKLGVVATKEIADDYLAKAKEEFKKNQEAIDKDWKAFEEKMAEMEASVKEKQAAADSAIWNANQALSQAEQKLKDASEVEAKAQDFLSEAQAAKETVKQEQLRLKEWEGELKDKAEKMMQLMGK